MTETAAELRFSSRMRVELIRAQASDLAVVQAARVSTLGEYSSEREAETAVRETRLEERDRGLISFLMRERHGTPFEHNSLTFLVQAPIFVFRELMRHRIASYNEESGRYRELQPHFYVPDTERKLIQVGKAGAYTFEAGTPEQQALVQAEIRRQSQEAYRSYRRQLAAGVAREVARMVLPLNLYSTAYVTLNARSLMNFLSLRISCPESRYPSYPQREIEICAEHMEQLWKQLMPVTHAAFESQGRVSP